MFEDICDIALSINFTKSEDCESVDAPSSPTIKTKNIGGFKCFKCYGTGIKNCQVCLGTQSVSSKHPLTKLLNNILLKKLNLKRQCYQKEEQQLQKVYPIKEQEEDIDEKRLVCSYCHCQCQDSLFYCVECPKLNVCRACQKKTINHQHQICENIRSTCKVDLVMVQQAKMCFSCQGNIQNCYSICKTCKDQGNEYWICDVCSDRKQYFHSSSHIMQAVIDYESFKDNNIETVSQQFEEDEDKSVQLSQQKNEQIVQQYGNIFLTKKNSSIANYLELMERSDDSPLLACNKSVGGQKKNDYTSRVRFQLDGLFSSYQFPTESKPASKNMICPPVVGGASRFNCNKSVSSKSNHKENQYQREQFQDFAFTGYKCDICNVEPIKNVRYHCTQCQDFDVCKNCYDFSLKSHEHITFDRIDHQEMRQQALQRLFHNKDTNLRTSINLTVRKTNRSRTVRLPCEY